MVDQYPNTRPVSFQYELALLAEEGGEVAQIVGKIFRFGYDSSDPAGGGTNIELLHEEVGDTLAVADFAVERGLLDNTKLQARRQDKLTKLRAISPPTYYPSPGAAAAAAMANPVTAPIHPTALAASTVSVPTTAEKIIAAIMVSVVVLMMWGGAYYFGKTSVPTPPRPETQVAVPAPATVAAPLPAPTQPVTDPTAVNDVKSEALELALKCYKTSIDTDACAGYAEMAGRPDLIPPKLKPIPKYHPKPKVKK